ncbi:NAD(P)-binding protein [Aspergillus granulosus]|uniref:NAD(P)-binding protein n=1 Tax=Aspergillus granulosus TaxID=176169 RepID=A0ABR4H632_9EURO
MDMSRLTNWPAINALVPTTHNDTYPFISPATTNLSGKSVLITGASKGIGREIALSFSRAGCTKIAIAARSNLTTTAEGVIAAAAEAGRPKPHILECQADLTMEQDVAAVQAQIAHAFGGSLDILVNNAGRCEAVAPLNQSRPDDFWASWEINNKGTYLVTRQLLSLLLNSQTRTVINVSTAGAHMLTPGLSGYQTSKFALCRFTEFLAKDYEDAGLVAISLHPGGVLTDMTLETPKEWHSHLQDNPVLAGNTVVWLVKERREWLSGRFVSSTWDMQELEGRREDIVSRDLLKFRLTV